ncbi:hypothetical protein N1851_023372 [Merluccius polli]|uniref:Uncharacterized protein n=1 Tax=Merluccius polli TaxID=89951 RepID=A0AA47NV41_MERPO|nr:hypothetical protein N1851_023372 [Merluccius polli]
MFVVFPNFLPTQTVKMQVINLQTLVSVTQGSVILHVPCKNGLMMPVSRIVVSYRRSGCDPKARVTARHLAFNSGHFIKRRYFCIKC